MDIIFQSGDFYNQSNFLSSVVMPFFGILIPASIAVYLFNKGIKEERKLDNEKREKDIKTQRLLDQERRKKDLEQQNLINENKLLSFGNHLQILLKNCIDTVVKQTKAYKNFAEQLEADDLGDFYSQQFTHENLNRLLKLDTERIVEFFIYKDINQVEFMNMIHQIDYLNIIFQKIPEDLNIGNGKEVNDLRNRSFVLREEILSTIAETIGEAKLNNENYLDSPFIAFLNQLLANYFKDNDGLPSIKRDYDVLIMPITNEFVKEKYLGNKVSEKLLKMVREGRNIVFTIKTLNKIISSEILEACNNINESSNKLSEVKQLIISKS